MLVFLAHLSTALACRSRRGCSAAEDTSAKESSAGETEHDEESNARRLERVGDMLMVIFFLQVHVVDMFYRLSWELGLVFRTGSLMGNR